MRLKAFRRLRSGPRMRFLSWTRAREELEMRVSSCSTSRRGLAVEPTREGSDVSVNERHSEPESMIRLRVVPQRVQIEKPLFESSMMRESGQSGQEMVNFVCFDMEWVNSGNKRREIKKRKKGRVKRGEIKRLEMKGWNTKKRNKKKE